VVAVLSRDVALAHPVLGEKQRPELVTVELLGVVELALHLLGEGLVPLGEDVEEGADADEVAHLELVATIDEQLEHYSQRRALTLKRRGRGHERVHEGRAERVCGAKQLAVAILGHEYVQHLGPRALGLAEGGVDLLTSRLRARLEQPTLGDLGQVAVVQRHAVEAVVPVLERVGERELFGTGDLVAHELAQVALARHEGDDRDRSRRGELDQLDQLLPLAGDERRVVDAAAEPQDQLIEEEHECVVPARACVAGELGQAGVHVDVAGARAAHRLTEAGHESRDDRPAEPPAVRVAGDRGAGLVVGLRRPGRSQLAPALLRTAAAIDAVEPLEELLVAEVSTEQFRLLEQRLVRVHAWERCVGVGMPKVRDVAAEDTLLHRLGADHVQRHKLEALASQSVVVLADRARELGDAARAGVALEQQVQDGHEVALARAEAAVEVGGLARPLLERRGDEAERVRVGTCQLIRHDVVLERFLAFAHALRQAHHEVALVDGLGDVDQFAQQRHGRASVGGGERDGRPFEHRDGQVVELLATGLHEPRRRAEGTVGGT